MTYLPRLDVVWLTAHPDTGPRGYWDQGIVERLIGRLRADVQHHEGVLPPDVDGALVVIPGRMNVGREGALRDDLARLRWAVIVVTSDEEGLFDADAMTEPAHRRLWVQTPRAEHPPDVRLLPVGCPPDLHWLYGNMPVSRPQPLDWMFAGQITHERRRQAVQVLRELDGDFVLVESDRFAGGLPYPDYARHLAAAKVAPCPSGPVTVDTFRIWEALHAGALPIVDTRTPVEDQQAYWSRLFPDGVPFPTVTSWDDLPALLDDAAARWPWDAIVAGSWWQQQQTRWYRQLAADIAAVGGPDLRPPLTVLMPTSPIPSHPDTSIIEETVGSLYGYPELAGCELVIMADGIRPEQEHRRADYHEYLRRLAWCTGNRWGNATLVVHPEHRHQAAMTRAALAGVDTDAVLFVEHDTPLTGDIPFEALARAVAGDQLDLVRLHHETTILEPHAHLMLDHAPRDVGGVPVLRTRQWSQRPHVASTGYYQRILREHFDADERWMIEDRLHSVVEVANLRRGEAGYADHRLAIYCPEGSLLRSRHLDGRGDDPKWVDR